MRRMKFLAAILVISSSTVSAFWNGNNTNWSPFGVGTGYNNQAPWANNSDWNPFGTSGNWGPRNDAANLSRYGAHPQSLTQYRQNPMFRPVDSMPSFQNRVKPSNWLKETDFASTLRQAGGQGKTFIVDDFAAFGLSDGYVRAKAETLGVGRVLRDRALQQTNDVFSDRNTIYGKQGYALSPAASSTRKINN
jgi:hypothetical protein